MAEYGFFHPQNGYQQFIGNRPKLPSEWVEVPLKPGTGYEWNGSEWVAVPEIEPTLAELRARWTATAAQIRIALDEAGRLNEIEAIAAASSRRTQIWWDKVESINRLSPTLGKVSALMTPPPSEEWWDALFAAAVAIET